MEEAGVVERAPYRSGASDYRLTESGRALLPVLDALLSWGREYAVAPGDPDRDRFRTTLAKEAR